MMLEVGGGRLPLQRDVQSHGEIKDLPVTSEVGRGREGPDPGSPASEPVISPLGVKLRVFL